MTYPKIGKSTKPESSSLSGEMGVTTWWTKYFLLGSWKHFGIREQRWFYNTMSVQVKVLDFMLSVLYHIKEKKKHISKEKILNFDQILKRLNSSDPVWHFHEAQGGWDLCQVTQGLWQSPVRLYTHLIAHPPTYPSSLVLWSHWSLLARLPTICVTPQS
jgi:hypothetical protein